MKTRIVLTGLLVATLVVVFVSTAAAVPPETRTYQFQVSGTLAECDGFEVVESATCTIREKKLFDQDGELVRIQAQWDCPGTVTNTATGKSFRDNGLGNVKDFPTGVRVVAGVTYHINVPGMGVIALSAGRFILDNGELVFDAGPHVQFDGFDTERLCEALAGEP